MGVMGKEPNQMVLRAKGLVITKQLSRLINSFILLSLYIIEKLSWPRDCMEIEISKQKKTIAIISIFHIISNDYFYPSAVDFFQCKINFSCIASWSLTSTTSPPRKKKKCFNNYKRSWRIQL